MNDHEQWQAEYRQWLDRIAEANGGISPTEIARSIGVSPSTITRQIKPGWTRRPSLDILRRLSQTFCIPIPASLIGQQENYGFAEPDVVPVTYAEDEENEGFEANLSDWQIKSPALAAMGCMPGDIARFDARIKPVSGDIVIAQVYRINAMGAETVMRLFMPPFLVAAEIGAPSIKPVEIDPAGERVVIMGTLVKRWYERKPQQPT